MLMFGTKMNAKQAETCGLVTQIFPHAQFEAEAWTRIKAMAKLPIKVSMLAPTTSPMHRGGGCSPT